MLIRSIRAENFMRFSSLQVTDLPPEGIIGIEGPNESGKSTVGEMLLFAFFGKMRPALESPLVRLIRWSASSMWVEVEFAIRPTSLSPPGGLQVIPGEYLIYREIDKYGTNYVKVLELPGRKELATGNIQVAEFISRVVRFDFQEFQQSFYHDQYENRRMQTEQVAFFERATGIDHMRQAGADLQHEITQFEREFSYYEKEISRNRSQIERYDRNVQKIEALAERSLKLQSSISEEEGQAARCQARARQLRQEAAARAERTKRLEGFADLSIESFLEELDGQLAAEAQLGGGNLDAAITLQPSRSPEAPRDESRSSQALYENESMRQVLAGTLPRLEKLRDLAREMVELSHLIRDEAEDLAKDLQADSRDGPVAEVRLLSDRSLRLSRRRRRARRVFVLLVLLLIAGLGALILYPLFSGAGGSLWSALKEEVLRPANQALPWLYGSLCVVLLLGPVLLLAKIRGDRRKLEDAARSRRRLEDKVADLEQVKGSLVDLLATARAGGMLKLIKGAEASGHRVVSRRAVEVRQRYASLLEDGGEDTPARFVASLGQSQKKLTALLAEEATLLEKEIQEAGAALKKARAEKDRVENEIRECQSQAAKKQALEEKNTELEAGAAQVRAEIDVRMLACRLLEETATSMRGKIGPSLTRFAKSVLPRLTSERYREVKVEENLEIKVFSSEKSDFLSIYELSGGTNEALSLALRLALSQTLVAARTRQAQFVFLDEPFKMMDMKRAVETLRALRELSPDLKQFLVIQPDFSEAERRLLNVLIQTSVKESSLEKSCNPQRAVLARGKAAAEDPEAERARALLSPQDREA